MRFKTALLGAALVLVAQTALAQDFERPGLYGALNGVYSVETFDNVPSSIVDNAVGVSMRGGYRFNSMFAAEMQYEYSGDFSDIGGNFAMHLVTMNGKVYLPLDRFQPYALVGMGFGVGAFDPGSNEESFLVRLGGGMDMYFNEQFGLLAEMTYNMATDDPIDDARYLSLGWGLFYRF
jgi:opacity protein-like surface antigen